ncbi:hypothetical protein BWI92_21770 [Flectobacillus sp. BAB-3569]|nr:hypothetical protein BWI92_21770 [Flectobacillus sp. BAB-3569]
MRTYKEAVDIMVDWWVEKSFKTPLNQNNGDNSDDGWLALLLMSDFSRKVQQKLMNLKFKSLKASSRRFY